MAAATVERPAPMFGWASVWRSLWLRKWQLAGVFVLTVGVYAAGLALPILTQRAVDMIASGTAGPQLVWFAGGAIVAIGCELTMSSQRESLTIHLLSFLETRISRQAFLQLMRMRIDRGAVPAGEVLNRFQQANKIPAFVLQQVPRTVFDAGNAVVSLLLMIYYDAVIGLFTLVVAVASGVMLRSRLGQVNVLAQRAYKSQGQRQSVLSESAIGLTTIKALALEGQRFGRWIAATEAVIAASRAVLNQMRRFGLGARMVMHAISLTVLALGCWRILNHQLSFGELLALQLLSGRLIAPILSSGDIVRQYQEAKVALTELGRFMAEPHERAARRPPVRELAEGGITAAGLTLRYAPTAPPALDDVSFTLPARGRFALVGRNGSGKSSLMRVLIGLRRGYTGDIAIAGHDLRHYDPRALRARIGIVDQDTVLFSGTIRHNVAAGISDADDARIRSALAFAGALELVEALPGGLDAELEENGRNLSGGQRQRLAIARAVVRDPRVVLLDEPTAFLDSEAAVALEQRLAAWAQDRLLILVTHHLAAARSADAILVLDQGRLVGFGSHAVLLRDCTPYAALWSDYVRSMEGELTGDHSSGGYAAV